MRQVQSTEASSDVSATCEPSGGGNASKSPGGGGGAKDRPVEYPKPTQGFTKPPKLSDLDVDMLSHTCAGLDTQTLGAFANSNRLFHASAQQTVAQRMAQALLEHVVRGEQDEAEELLEKNPRLLRFKTGNTFDYSGRSIKGLSAWQAALCAGDCEMLAMMESHFDSIEISIPNPEGNPTVMTGEQIRLEQTQQVFPEGFEAHVAEQAAAEAVFNFGALVEAIDGSNADQLESAINLEGAVLPATEASLEKTSDGAASDLTKALNAFRKAFTTHSLQEKIFNPQHLLCALEIYCDRCDDWSDKQCHVFWSQVVGFTQRFMPACYAQAFAQGLIYLNNKLNPQRLKRSFSFKVRSGDDKIFSGDANVGGLGFKFAAGVGGWALRWPAGPGWDILHHLRYSDYYVEQEQTTLRTYARTRAADPVGTLVALSR